MLNLQVVGPGTAAPRRGANRNKDNCDDCDNNGENLGEEGSVVEEEFGHECNQVGETKTAVSLRIEADKKADGRAEILPRTSRDLASLSELVVQD